MPYQPMTPGGAWENYSTNQAATQPRGSTDTQGYQPPPGSSSIGAGSGWGSAAFSSSPYFQTSWMVPGISPNVNLYAPGNSDLGGQFQGMGQFGGSGGWSTVPGGGYWTGDTRGTNINSPDIWAMNQTPIFTAQPNNWTATWNQVPTTTNGGLSHPYYTTGGKTGSGNAMNSSGQLK